MSECKVFNPVKEIADLNKRVEQLEQELKELRCAAVTKPAGAFAGWNSGGFSYTPYENWPKGYDGQPLKYTLEGK